MDWFFQCRLLRFTPEAGLSLNLWEDPATIAFPAYWQTGNAHSSVRTAVATWGGHCAPPLIADGFPAINCVQVCIGWRLRKEGGGPWHRAQDAVPTNTAPHKPMGVRVVEGPPAMNLYHPDLPAFHRIAFSMLSAAAVGCGAGSLKLTLNAFAGL